MATNLKQICAEGPQKMPVLAAPVDQEDDGCSNRIDVDAKDLLDVLTTQERVAKVAQALQGLLVQAGLTDLAILAKMVRLESATSAEIIGGILGVDIELS